MIIKLLDDLARAYISGGGQVEKEKTKWEIFWAMI